VAGVPNVACLIEHEISGAPRHIELTLFTRGHCLYFAWTRRDVTARVAATSAFCQASVMQVYEFDKTLRDHTETYLSECSKSTANSFTAFNASASRCKASNVSTKTAVFACIGAGGRGSGSTHCHFGYCAGSASSAAPKGCAYLQAVPMIMPYSPPTGTRIVGFYADGWVGAHPNNSAGRRCTW
jgi:hypothetical protein